MTSGGGVGRGRSPSAEKPLRSKEGIGSEIDDSLQGRRPKSTDAKYLLIC